MSAKKVPIPEELMMKKIREDIKSSGYASGYQLRSLCNRIKKQEDIRNEMYYCLTHGHFPTSRCVLVKGQSAYEYAGEFYETCDAYDGAYAYEQMLDDREEEEKMKANSLSDGEYTYDAYLDYLFEVATDQMVKEKRDRMIREELAKGGKIINLSAIVRGGCEEIDELPFP